MPASPCINLCQMDPERDICRGCYRNLDEITRWSRASDDEKNNILALIKQRRQAWQATALPTPVAP